MLGHDVIAAQHIPAKGGADEVLTATDRNSTCGSGDMLSVTIRVSLDRVARRGG